MQHKHSSLAYCVGVSPSQVGVLYCDHGYLELGLEGVQKPYSWVLGKGSQHSWRRLYCFVLVYALVSVHATQRASSMMAGNLSALCTSQAPVSGAVPGTQQILSECEFPERKGFKHGLCSQIVQM